MKGVDFASRAAGERIAAEGFEFVMRYVPYPGGEWKGITAAEVADFRANGLRIGLVFERNEERPLEGRSAGITDAIVSARAAEALGFPAGQAIYFAVDFGPTADQLLVVAEYFRGIVGTLGIERVGCYGGSTVLRYLRGRGLTTYMWEALATSWGNGPMEGRHLWQYRNNVFIPAGDRNGTPVDYNQAYDGAEKSLWLAEEDEMSANDLARLARLERIVAANGVDTDGDGEVDLTGEEALAFLGGDLEGIDPGIGASHALTLARHNAAILALQGGGFVPGGITPHTHEPGPVQG